jgi:GH35 family endo-1,4-beta-xylanase
MVRATVTLVGRDGEPLRGAPVTVGQLGHAFGFGNIGFDFVGLANAEHHAVVYGPSDGASADRAPRLADLWFELFSTATLPFYWGRFEPMRGLPDTRRLLRTAQWFVDKGCTVKGHPLLWHTLAPPWLLDLSSDEVMAAVRGRIRREVTDFAEVISTWDAINEAVIMPVFDRQTNAITFLSQRLGRVGMVRLAVETARAARAASPGLTLLINDFDMSPAYERLIEECLDAGVTIDGIGLQSHMHQGYWGEAKTLDVLGRFSEFGLPLHMSETTLVSGELMPPEIEDLNDFQVPSWPSTPEGEARQADELVRHYRTLVEHPSVRAVTYWGLSDHGAWLGAPSGLVRADGTVKPAYEALRRLVKDEWWLAPSTIVADEEGRVVINGFVGTYQVVVDGTRTVIDLGRPGVAEEAIDLRDRDGHRPPGSEKRGPMGSDSQPAQLGRHVER